MKAPDTNTIQVSLFVTILSILCPRVMPHMHTRFPSRKLIHVSHAINPCLSPTRVCISFCSPAPPQYRLFPIHVELRSETMDWFPSLIMDSFRMDSELGLCDHTTPKFSSWGVAANCSPKNVRISGLKSIMVTPLQIQAFELMHVWALGQMRQNLTLSCQLVTSGWAKGVLRHLGESKQLGLRIQGGS